MSGVGGLLIMAIGFNLLEFRKSKSNMLPTIAINCRYPRLDSKKGGPLLTLPSKAVYYNGLLFVLPYRPHKSYKTRDQEKHQCHC
jgi:hypothetical protein